MVSPIEQGATEQPATPIDVQHEPNAEHIDVHTGVEADLGRTTLDSVLAMKPQGRHAGIPGAKEYALEAGIQHGFGSNEHSEASATLTPTERGQAPYIAQHGPNSLGQ